MDIYRGNNSVVIYLIEYYRQYFLSCEFCQIKCLTYKSYCMEAFTQELARICNCQSNHDSVKIIFKQEWF